MSLLDLLIASRPWSLPVTLAAVVVAVSSAYVAVGWNVDAVAVVLGCVGSLLLQCGGNYWNTYRDYVAGIDTTGSADDRTIVDGVFTAATIYRSALVSIALGAIFASAAIAHGVDFANTAASLTALLAAGIVAAILYSGGPLPLKHIGGGDVVVFLIFGPALIAANFIVAAKRAPNFSELSHSIPVGLTTTAVLHVNNARDVIADRAARIMTVPMMIGPINSRILFASMYLIAFAFAGYCAVTSSVVHLLPAMLLPTAIQLVDDFAADRFDGLCARTGQFSFHFAALHAAAILIASYVHH